jgi:hypothetical protein
MSLFAGQALGGRAWAFGLTVAAVSVPFALAVHAAFFALGSAFANLISPEEAIARTSRGAVMRSERQAANPLPQDAPPLTSDPAPTSS